MTLIAGRLATMPPSAVQPDPRAYVRIAAMIREMISSQVLPPGSPAPSITRLCREHGHARQTCGKAMHLLEDEGLLHRVPGSGITSRCRER
jgi:DNA-binding GntR family transcriptional regulator